MLTREKDKKQRINQVLSGVVAGSLLMGGAVPVYQMVSEGVVLTAEAASDIAPKALQKGDQVTQSTRGLKFLNGTLRRTGDVKADAQVHLEFEIVDGIQNNSGVSMAIRLQTTNLGEIGFDESRSHWGDLVEEGTDLTTDSGVKVGEFRGGMFRFNDQVENYVGSKIQLDMNNVGVTQLITPKEGAVSMTDAVYWDVLLGHNLMDSRDVAGTIKEEGQIWYHLDRANTDSRVSNTLVVRDGVPQLGLSIAPGNNQRMRNLLNRSSAPITYRIEYNISDFGGIPATEKAVLHFSDSSVKPIHAKHKEGYAGVTPSIPGYAESDSAVIKQVKPGVYEFTIHDPVGNGIGTTSAPVNYIYIPILDASIIDQNALKFNSKPTVTMYQNGKVVGGTENNSSITDYVKLGSMDHIPRSHANITADVSYQEEKEVEELPFETIRRDNPDLPAGEERVVQQGVKGERTRTYSVLYINGRPTGTKELKGEQVTKKPVDHIVEVGAGTVSESVDVSVETIPYETIRRDNPELPAGEERVVQAGKPGSKKITTTTPTMNGKPTGDPKVTEEVTKQPVDQIIEVGVGVVDQTVDTKTESIPYETEVIYDENLPEGERVIDQEGVEGEKTITTTTPTLNGQPNGQPVIGEEVTKQPVKEIIRVGSGVVDEDVKVETQELPFDTEIVENPDLPEGEERVIQEGHTGSLTITTTTPTLNGQTNGEPVIQEEVTKEPINQVIEVGVGTLGESTQTETVELPFETQRVSNPDLPKGEERIVQEGEVGEKTITTTTPTLNDQPHGESVVEETVTKDPVDKIIEVGTGIVLEDVTEDIKEIPYETEIVYDKTLPEGEEVIEQVGELGELITTTTIPTLNGEPNGDPTVEEEIVKAPVKEVIRIGTGQPTEDISTKVMKIPFETEVIYDKDLPEGQRIVEQEGEEGERTITTTIPLFNGEPSGDPVVTEEITKDPVTRIIRVGSQIASHTVNVEQREIPFETEVIEDPNLPEGESRVEQEGVVGVVNITTKTPTLNGEPSGDPEVTEEVAREAQNRIVRVGTGQVDTPQPDNKPEPEAPQEPQTPQAPQPDQKPDVKTGVEGVRTNSVLATTIGTAIGGLLASLGFTSRRKRDE